jgi:hypothetical protein
MYARRTVKVKAGSKMCSLGDIRKGGARATMEQYCAECPYFIHDKFVTNERAREALERVSPRFCR